MICSSCKRYEKSDGDRATEREFKRQELLEYALCFNYVEKCSTAFGLEIYFIVTDEDDRDIIQAAIYTDGGSGRIEVLDGELFNSLSFDAQSKALDVLSFYVAEGIKYFGK